MSVKEKTGLLVETTDKGIQKLLDVKPCSGVSNKKMVQARLPFKRLNLAPKDKGSISKQKRSNEVQKGSALITECTFDDLENGCKMETEEAHTVPKLLNGWGPLDNYVRKISKACNVIPITIDLTEDSNSGLVDKLPSTGQEQSSLPNGPNFQSCDIVKSPSLLQQAGHDLEDGDCKQPANTDSSSAEEITEMRRESTELQNADSAQCVLSSPVTENAEDEDTALSSNSSPISSPDESTSSVLKCGRKSISPTGRCKVKDQHLRRKKLQSEKEKRDSVREEQKIAKERAKEEAKRKKDEEREQKAKEKKEKKEKEDREKAEKMRLKEEKKKEKLEALEAKQEEKRKKEEEKRMKDEEKRVKAEKAEITRFLQKSKSPQTPKTFAQSCGKFAPFEIKKNMAVAPLCRVEFEAESSEQLTNLIKEQDLKVNFLLELQMRKPRRMGRTVMPKLSLISDTDDVTVLLENDLLVHENISHELSAPERTKFGKMKLLQFCENYRPAYWGTWNRSSAVICPRRPWAQDSTLFDYEVDSDEEWEEEEPGESLSHSEGDDDEDPKEEEEDDDDEDDDGFFVPHGYLSEDEGGASDEECKNPENQKVHQRLKAKEWDELQSKGKKINVLKPVLIGCVWLGDSRSEIAFLQKFSACVLDTVIPVEEDMAQESSCSRKLEDREILMQLLPLLHGNVNGSKTIIREFQECCRRGIIPLGDGSKINLPEFTSPNACHQSSSSINIPSKARLKRIISDNSVYEKRPDHRLCWYVYNDILKSFHQESLPVPCQWTYVTPVNLPREDMLNPVGQTQATSSAKRKSAGSMPITKFMKKTTVVESCNNAGTETDCFHADTEEDDDEDNDDCMIVEEPFKTDAVVPTLNTTEVTLSEHTLSNAEISGGSN